MNEPRVRDLMKGFGDAVVPLEDEPASAGARARALPRIEASLRAVAASNVRRSRTRRVAVAIGIAAALAIGVASAMLALGTAAPPVVATKAVLAPAIATGSAPLAAAPSTAAPPDEPAAADPNGDAKEGAHDDVANPSPPRPRLLGSGSARASASSEVSTLADQNRLLGAALEARKRNDDGKAIVFLNELLRKYPSSPLAQEARVERLRCLERLGRRGAAADEARRYLTDYPDGFAREEAKGQASPAPSAPSKKP